MLDGNLCYVRVPPLTSIVRTDWFEVAKKQESSPWSSYMGSSLCWLASL